MGNQIESIRKLYEPVNIQNVIPDGTVSFPEETTTLKSGIELEFRWVLFAPRKVDPTEARYNAGMYRSESNIPMPIMGVKEYLCRSISSQASFV